MRSGRWVLVSALAVFGLMALGSIAHATTLADLNSFSGQPGWYSSVAAASSTVYGGFAPASALVGSTLNAPPFIFADNQSNYYINFSGLNGTSLSAIRLFDDGWDQRTPTNVSVYYSSANTTSLNPGDYHALGATTLNVTNDNYDNQTSNASEVGQRGTPIHYADVASAIPAGTRSVLLELSCANPGWGGALQQVQGIVGENVLQGKTVTTSSAYNGSFVPSAVTDGVAGEFAYSDGDPTRAMAITGFDSPLKLIRIWACNDRIPSTVSIGSTTVANSTDMNDYTPLATVSNLVFNSQGFADIAVDAPVGTQGLGFLWGPGNNASGTAFAEIQAFATGQVVPEPSAIILAICGAISLLAYVWRKRK
jgi:hypothetical protein